MRPLLSLSFALLIGHLSAQQAWTLQQCVQRAEDKNLTVRDAQLNAELADRVHDQAFWSFLPNLNAGGTHGYNWGKTIDRYTNTFATDRVQTNNFWLSSNLAVYQGGLLRNTHKQTGISEDAAMKGLEAARNDVRTEVVRAFINALGLKERIASAEGQLANTREQEIRVSALVDAGRSARSELLDVQAQLASEEYNVTDLRGQLEQAMLQLGQALLLDPSEQATFAIQAPPITSLDLTAPTATEQEVLSRVLASNPAYAQATLNAESAEMGVDIARAGTLPTVSLSASVGTGYSGRNIEAVGEPIITQQPIGATASGDIVYAPSFNYSTRTRAFGSQLDDNLNESLLLTLNVPIFNNKQNSLAMDRARISHEQAKNRMENRRMSLQRDVQSALVAQRNAFKQYESARRSVEAAELALQFAQDRFDHGAINAIELNTVKVRLLQSEANRINAKYSYLMAQKSLEILQGLPLSL